VYGLARRFQTLTNRAGFARGFALFLALLFLAQYAAFERGWFQPATNYRVRTGSLMRNAVIAAGHWKGLVRDPLVRTPDDLGSAYLLAGLLYVGNSKEEFERKEWHVPPESFFFLMSLPYLFTLLLSFFALDALVSRGFAVVFTLLLAFSRLGGFLAFSGDVYQFSLLAMFIPLAWAAALRRAPGRWALWATLAALALFVCELFRTTGPTVLAPALAAAVLAPRLRLPTARPSAALLGLLVLALPRALPPSAKHPFWHALHVGLFEFGGCNSRQTGKAFPYFVRTRRIPPNCFVVSGWSDEIQDDMLRHLDPTYRGQDDYKESYESFFRDEVLFLVKYEPVGLASLAGRRAWNLLVANPWPTMDDDSRIHFREPRDTILRVVLALLVGAALFFGAWHRAELGLFASLLAFAAPALLVHSGYLIYNAPATTALLLLGLWSARFVLYRSAAGTSG
jgi:hypothetical protein